MSNYPGYPPPFSTWDTFTPSVRPPFPLGSLHLTGLAPGLTDPAFLPPAYRSPLSDPLSSLGTTSHLGRHPGFPRYLPGLDRVGVGEYSLLGLDPLYGLGPQETLTRGLLLSPNLSFSQNPSPLTFDQIYRPGASSVSPVSQYRSHFDERALSSRLSVPGRLSEPLRRENFVTSKGLDKSDKLEKASEKEKTCDKPGKIWNPFSCEIKNGDKNVNEKQRDNPFSIEALTKTSNKCEEKSHTVDANGNNVVQPATEKTWPERPIPKYPVRPIPVFNLGFPRPLDGFGSVKSSCDKLPVVCSSSQSLISKAVSNCQVNTTSCKLTEAEAPVTCVSDVKNSKALEVSKEVVIEQERITKPTSETEKVLTSASDIIESNVPGSVDVELESHSSGSFLAALADIVNSSTSENQTNSLFHEEKEPCADKCVPYNTDNAKVKVQTKELQVSLPKLEIEIPNISSCDSKKGSGSKSSKQPEICSPPASSKLKTVSPLKRATKKEELKQLSIQVNEVRNRRTSKDSKLLSPNIVSPDARSNSLSENLLSPPITESVPKTKVKCSSSSSVKKRRLSLPALSRGSGPVRHLARMSSAEGAITMMKSTEDSLSASISSSHLSESDSDTQLSTDQAEKLFRESQPINTHNTQPSFSSPPPTGNSGYMPSLAVDGMNHNNQYYKPTNPQMCQSDSDNQKPYPCVQAPMYPEKPDVLPPYSCFTTNQSPNILPREPSFHSQEENSNFAPTLTGVDSSIDYDENSIMSDSSQMRPPRCDSQSSLSHGPEGQMPCKDQMLPSPMPNQEAFTSHMPDEGQWDFLHSKQYIETIYGGQAGCEVVNHESEEVRESDSPKCFLDLDKTTKEKKAQESQKDKVKEGHGSKHYGKGMGRSGYPGMNRHNPALYGNQAYDNYNHMVGSRWSSFNRGEGMMGHSPRPGTDNYGGTYDHGHQYRNNFPPNYHPSMGQSQNGGEKPPYNSQQGYHGNEYNQNEYYQNQNQPKNFPSNYGNGRFDNGYYQNRGNNDYNAQNNMYPGPGNEMQGSRFPGQGFSGAQANFNQHYGQPSTPHGNPENQAPYQETPSFNIPRNASPASTGSDFSSMEAPGGVPKKKRGRKRKVDKEPPDENKPRPNTIVMAPTKIGPLVDIDNPDSTIDTYDYNNQIETIFNFTIEDDLSPIGAQYLQIEQRLCQKMLPIKYGYPVTVIYSPLTYAFQTHRDFVAKYCTSERTLLFLGMNPGPYGMSQNGVPFGEAVVTRDWLKITGDVYKPEIEHPKKPITGLACTRNEVSGARFWGLFQKVCKVPENFFKNCYVYNFCPLAYMSESGKNVTPPQLVHSELDQINECCDVGLVELVKLMNISVIVAVGKFVQQRASKALHNAGVMNIKVECILHPSPINPHANKGWEQIVAKQLIEMNVMHYLNSDREDVQRCIEEWERIAQSNMKVPIMDKESEY